MIRVLIPESFSNTATGIAFHISGVKGTFLGIAAEGLQARVTKDSVVLVQKVGDKSVTKRSIAYLQEECVDELLDYVNNKTLMNLS